MAVVFAYYEEWSQMVSDLREQAKTMMQGYEERCKEKKVSKQNCFIIHLVKHHSRERYGDWSIHFPILKALDKREMFGGQSPSNIG